MNTYPKIGIRPTIDGRQGGVRESLEEKTMALAKAVARCGVQQRGAAHVCTKIKKLFSKQVNE